MSEKSKIAPGMAALLSLLVPGLGQLCQQRFAAGFGFMLFVLVGYYLTTNAILTGTMRAEPGMFYLVLGLVHLMSVVDGAVEGEGITRPKKE